MSKPIPLSKVFPIYKIENDCILSKHGDVTLAYKVTLPEIFTLSDQEYEAFHQVLIKAIKILPANSILHKQDWFFQKDTTQILKVKTLRFFHEQVRDFSMNVRTSIISARFS